MVQPIFNKLIAIIIGASILVGCGSGAIVWDDQPLPHRNSLPSVSSIPATSSSFSLNSIQALTGLLFSSPKTSFDQRKQIISSTQGHLDMRMYDITYNRAKLPIVTLAEAGIPIRVILEDKKYQSFGNSYLGTKALFEDVGIKIMSDSDLGLGTNFVHAKVFVTPSRGLVETANLTDGGFNSSREYYTYFTDSGVVANLQQLFNADRKGKPLKSNQIHPNILVCPINCRHVIQSLISGAQSSIIIQNQYIEDKTLTTLLLAKQKQMPNLKLQIIVADNEFASGTMRRFGTDHARVLTSPYPHAKMMLIDDRYLLVSSINYSSNSMDRNREIGVIITNREAIDYFTTQFTKDRDKSKLISKFKKKYSKSTN